jgi:hypothetical protein
MTMFDANQKLRRELAQVTKDRDKSSSRLTKYVVSLPMLGHCTGIVKPYEGDVKQ